MSNSFRILVVDDDPRHRALFVEVLATMNLNVLEAADGDEALEKITLSPPDMVVSDVQMPGTDGITLLRETRAKGIVTPFLLVTAFPAVRDAVEALKLGAVDYLEKPVDLDELSVAVRDVLQITTPSPSAAIPDELMRGVVAEDPSTIRMFEQCHMVAQSDTTVLITGESGTGKEVMANFIHASSSRADERFMAINCAAIPANLIAAELFGHVRGAFTGADGERNGKFREADGGTVFLDEIGDMPLDVQPALLRVLETGTLSPVGSDDEFSVNVRVVAATNKDLTEAVKDKSFREDLYYRLNVIAFDIPPLRDRTADVIPLAKHFLRQYHDRKRLSSATEQILKGYQWPGNVRELANAIQRGAVLSPTEVILPEHLPPALLRQADGSSNDGTGSMVQAEREAILAALEATGGNRTKAAERLGISRRSLVYKLKRYDIS